MPTCTFQIVSRTLLGGVAIQYARVYKMGASTVVGSVVPLHRLPAHVLAQVRTR